MDATNTGFLAKQLLLTELDGEVVDYVGGSLVMCDLGIWAGIWEPLAIPDPEEYITDLMAKAEEYGSELAGVVMLIPGAMEQEEKVVQLAEALFVYGYTQPEGDVAPPDMIQVCAKPPKPEDDVFIEFRYITGGHRIMLDAIEEAEQMYSNWNAENADLFITADTILLQEDREPIGIMMLTESDLALRVIMLWIKEEFRNKGYGKTVLADLINSGVSSSKLLLSAWTHRTGRMRYFFQKCGFEEQLRALYFLPEK